MKIKTVILIIASFVLLSGCGKVMPPEELQSFVKNKDDEIFWNVSFRKDPLGITITQNLDESERIIRYSFADEMIPTNFNDFKRNIYKVSISDDIKHKGQVIIWSKKETLDNPFEKTSATVYELDEKDFLKNFNSTECNLSISLKKVSKFKPLEEQLINWTGYKSHFNVKNAVGIFPFREDKGNIVLLIHNTKNKIREGYLTLNGLEYIRHVEYGYLPFDIAGEEPNELIEAVWKVWNQELKPSLKQFQNLKVD